MRTYYENRPCVHKDLSRQVNEPIKLNTEQANQVGKTDKTDVKPSLDYECRIKRDCADVSLTEYQATQTGQYQLSGFDPTPQTDSQYSSVLSALTKSQKVTNAGPFVSQENNLIYSQVNHFKGNQQLMTRPYVGMFAGAGSPSIDNKELETALFQGDLTNLRQKPCQVTRDTTLYRYQYLPEFGNPQRVQHIIPPPLGIGGWVRGGDATRDYVRRVTPNFLKQQTK